MTTINADYHDLLLAPNTAVLTTLQPDGGPNGSPVWFLFEDDAVFVSTLADRAKHRNVANDPRVSLTVVDPQRPLRYVEVRGVVELIDDPEGEMRDRVAGKHGYADGSAFDPPGASRVTMRITPQRVIEH
ncbi:MAG: PPOX class F420-dependent oxidoreductase [Actinomycetota bacterium]